MASQCLIWKRITSKNLRGQDYESSYPDIIDLSYRGNLAAEILAMPRKIPMSFGDAVRSALDAAMKAPGGQLSNWYHRNFVRFISDNGYHIELSGDEFVFHLSTDRAL